MIEEDKIKEIKPEPDIEPKLELDHKAISALNARKHFMIVCKHGVPHGSFCGGCEKVISIPEDAKIKPIEE